MGRASVPTPALYPAFFFVPEKPAKSAGNAVIPTFPTRWSHGLQGFLKRCYAPLPYFHQWVSHIKRVLAQAPTNGPRLLSRVKAGTHSPFRERSHTTAHTAKQGAFRMGVVSLLSERSARSPTSPGRVSERQVLPLLGLGRGCSQRTQRAFGTAMRLCASLSRGVAAPLGCVICLQLGDVAVFSLCAQYFLNVRGGGGITTLGVLCVFSKRRTAACQNGSFAVF